MRNGGEGGGRGGDDRDGRGRGAAKGCIKGAIIGGIAGHYPRRARRRRCRGGLPRRRALAKRRAQRDVDYGARVRPRGRLRLTAPAGATEARSGSRDPVPGSAAAEPGPTRRSVPCRSLPPLHLISASVTLDPGAHGRLLYRRHALRRSSHPAPARPSVRLAGRARRDPGGELERRRRDRGRGLHVGDFAAHAERAHCAAIFARLNGVKRLVRGNHDSNRVLELPWADPPVESARITLREDGREWRLFLAHYAHRAWPGLWRGTPTSTATPTAPCRTRPAPATSESDAWDYRPVRLPALAARQDAAALVPEELARDRAGDDGVTESAAREAGGA